MVALQENVIATCPLRAAIVGCGKIAGGFAETNPQVGIYTHVQAYQACGHTILVAVCDQDASRAEEFARRWGVPRWYADPREMMASEQPDLVSLCTPDETHAALALQLLDGKVVPRGILCEKPLALSMVDAQRIVERARVREVRWRWATCGGSSFHEKPLKMSGDKCRWNTTW